MVGTPILTFSNEGGSAKKILFWPKLYSRRDDVALSVPAIFSSDRSRKVRFQPSV